MAPIEKEMGQVKSWIADALVSPDRPDAKVFEILDKEIDRINNGCNFRLPIPKLCRIGHELVILAEDLWSKSERTVSNFGHFGADRIFGDHSTNDRMLLGSISGKQTDCHSGSHLLDFKLRSRSESLHVPITLHFLF